MHLRGAYALLPRRVAADAARARLRHGHRRCVSRGDAAAGATFRRIVKHLQDNPDVQNIDLMNLANFCRNCISKWYVSESSSQGEELSYDAARELIYGMPYDSYKEKHQKEATKEQLDKFNASQKNKG